MIEINGKGVSGGYAIGKIHFVKKDNIEIKKENINDVKAELGRYKMASKKVAEELLHLKKKAEAEAGSECAEIFEVHKMMLESKDFKEDIEKCIQDEHCNAEYAIEKTARNLSDTLPKDDEYMKGRMADINDISQRLIRILTCCDKEDTDIPDDAQLIICADELSPSQIIRMDKSKVIAFAMRYGSAQSHTAILAGSMNIPAIVGLGDLLSDVYDGMNAIVDGKKGCIDIGPTPEKLEETRRAQRIEKQHRDRLNMLRGMNNITIDGRRVMVYANIGTPKDIQSVIRNDAGGIGLFRSEFLYLQSNKCPTEEEQFEAYKAVLEKMNGKKVIIRTLDIGADKKIDYLDLDKEENPALGFRAIRICLSRHDIFKEQIRALLRASAYGKLSIMIPMVISVDEVKETRRIFNEVKTELRAKKIPFDGAIEFGIMIETPAAVMISDILAREVDFFSIGTNDLTQYTLAVDRQNPRLELYYDPKHTAIMRMIKKTVDNAHNASIWCGICGEIAADLSATEMLLAMGVDEFSVSPHMILPLREKIRSVNVGKVKNNILI